MSKSIEELIEFLNINVKKWQEEKKEFSEGITARDGALQCCELIGKFLDGELEPVGEPESETDVEEAAAENIPK